MTANSIPSGSSSPVDTVLVVDGEVLVRMLISEYLRQCGYRVVEAVDAEEAKLVLSADIGIDVVLSVVEMPGTMDGFRLAKWVRENRKDVKVVLAGTVARAADVAGELCDEGPMLTRPYEPQAVVERVKWLLAERAGRK